MLAEPGRGHEVGDRALAQSGQDLGRKDCGVGGLAAPLAHRPLVPGVLAVANLGSAPAVRGVALLGAQLSENGVSRLTSAIAAPRDSFGSARFAVPALPVAERRTAVGGSSREARASSPHARVSCPILRAGWRA
jgi:hypothetical protein